MKLRLIVTSIALIAFVSPSFAADYYVVQNVKTKKCQVVSKKPTTKTQVTVGPDGTVYKTRTEASNAMKTIEVCKTK